ncbi:Flp family type IVb pilin [Alloacidobacterium dinghuense]|uniref:Flp family type IVb pilin n=1 Tax=Alloacidobacterium dinghuense TaxID=2763107 RepID=A0A7G8BK19_9BACT|nr:Flp family type IVb pilin [Alloacidobacterium dinghuense]QNI32889.1 Flp family type IVb pilin [Alloacidobacterium dinghuense]
MQFQWFNLYARVQRVFLREEGQDLIEYALVVALIAFGATVGMGTVASSINNAFVSIQTALSANVT